MDGLPPRRAAALILGRGLAAAFGVCLLVWAYEILDNIWHYNDSGTVAYILFAAVPGVAGLTLVYLSVRPPRGTGEPPYRAGRCG